MDVLNPEQRNRCMSHIKGQNTKPEMKLRRALWKAGKRFRLKSNLPGKPDLIFPGKKVAVFVDGCFWHKCPDHFKAPDNNSKFWAEKIQRNVKRDQMINEQLNTMGWRVIRFWEHQIQDDVQFCVQALFKALGYKNE